MNDDENCESETSETSEVSQVLLEDVQSPNGRFGGSLEGIGLVHFGQEGSENEVEDSREEGEGSCDQEEPDSDDSVSFRRESTKTAQLTMQLMRQTSRRVLLC